MTEHATGGEMTERGAFWRTFTRIGLMSFGGPAAQIALMHRELVDNRRCLSEAEFLRALSFCMLLPGPEAMQLATYAGWRLRGIPGGLIAGLLFVIPGALVILALAAAYAAWGHIPVVSALFFGIKAAVVIVVIEALLRVSRRALTGGRQRLIAAAGFVGLAVFNLPFPMVIILAALAGAFWLDGRTSAPVDQAAPPHVTSLLPVLLAGAALWTAPLVLLGLSGQDFLLQLGLFFSKLAVVTFGGAYAVLAYMTQMVVQDYGWISTAQMMDALGLAETTPGPLILVTEFVAYLAGMAQGGTGMALGAAALTLWVTFVPCFLWIFAFAPYIDWLSHRAALAAAMQGVTAAVVGVIGNLALWFALHVLFAHLTPWEFGPVHLLLPDPATLDLRALGLAFLAGFALLRLHWPLSLVLLLAAGGGILALSL